MIDYSPSAKAWAGGGSAGRVSGPRVAWAVSPGGATVSSSGTTESSGGLFGREQGQQAVGIAYQADRLVASGHKLADDVAADETAAAGDENLHRWSHFLTVLAW